MRGEGSQKPTRVTFVGGKVGSWRVEGIDRIRGASLPRVSRIAVIPGWEPEKPPGSLWYLRGITEEEHYTSTAEKERLRSIQPELGRPTCTRAALIPIRKSSAWWKLPVGERRAIFEERSHHIATGLEYLPAIARRLYHGRGRETPFDFLTWFEFAPADAPAFDRLVGQLRQTEEWGFVQREVEIRLRRIEGYRS